MTKTARNNKAYGLPYKGSKNRIAEWVVGVLPENDTLVDLFAGGCAVTHCAMLSGKFKRVIANDVNEAPELFGKALRGGLDTSAFPVTRAEFEESTDLLTRIVYSYGNDTRSYIYGREREDLRLAGERVIYGGTIEERYAAYLAFMRVLRVYVADGGALNRDSIRLQGVENCNRIFSIEGGAAEFLSVRGDYGDLQIPTGATVYADPPYKGTTITQYGAGFDYDAFEDWLDAVDFPVFVSEYTCPRGCVEIAKLDSFSLADNSNRKRVMERLFVQERFRDFVVTGDVDGE